MKLETELCLNGCLETDFEIIPCVGGLTMETITWWRERIVTSPGSFV